MYDTVSTVHNIHNISHTASFYLSVALQVYVRECVHFWCLLVLDENL